MTSAPNHAGAGGPGLAELLVTPEVRLLVALARLGVRTADPAAIAQQCPGVDWSLFLGIASRHRLIPVSFSHLRALTPCPMPLDSLVALWGRSELIRRQSIEMKDILVQLVACLQDAGIRVVPFKGPLLALSAYGDVAMREFGDLDVLVPFADLVPARRVLESLGYRAEYPMPEGAEAAFLNSRHNYHLSLLDASESNRVELHWKTDSEFAVEPADDDAWWSGLPVVTLDGLEVRSLPPEDLLLVLCLHGSKHNWSRLNWLVDVAELIRKEPELDWTWILRRAEDLRAGTGVALGLHLLGGLLGVPLPSQVLSWLSTQSKARHMAESITRQLSETAMPTPTAMERLRLNFALRETWQARFRHLVRVVFKPTVYEWSRWQLPAALFWLYPLLRVQRLCGKYLSALIGRDEAGSARH